MWKLFVYIKLLLCCLYSTSLACGATTHIEISYRALYNYDDKYGNVSYNTIIQQNQDALEAGSAFPDAFYPVECFQGKYHDVAEDTHWTPFINASINYIQRKYPKPWDESTKKLVAFIMGVQSHQVADVSWHSLGIDQGFLQAMAKTNFHGDFPSAHSAGDLGGDVLNLFQLNLNYSDVFGEWYIPVDDLLNIYEEFYGNKTVKEDLVVTCSKLLFLVKVAERIAVKEYFPISAKASPFLVDELDNYFLGGLEDMAAWTQRIWKHFTFALENGQRFCKMDFNPLFIRCNDTSGLVPHIKNTAGLKNGFYTYPKNVHTDLSYVVAERSGRGLVLKPGTMLKDKFQQVIHKHLNSKPNLKNVVSMNIHTSRSSRQSVQPVAVVSSYVQYARLGSAYAVADLNNDGNEDVVVGAPGFYSSSQQQKTGMVFVVFGTDQGLNTSITDISQLAQIKIPGPLDPHGADSQFGASVAIFDVDKDGKLDIAVAAPSYGSVNLTYTGQIFIFSLVTDTQYILRAVVTCKDVYCNLGTSLVAGDVNYDLYADLIIGSHFAPGSGEQRGTVGVVVADTKYAGKSDIQILLSSSLSSSEEFYMQGSQNYSWLGRSLAVKKFYERNETYIAIGEPGSRKCARSNCSFDPADIQAVGGVYLMSASDRTIHLKSNYQGAQPFQMFGAQVAFGQPFGNFTDVLAIAATGQSETDHTFNSDQVGFVHLYNVSSSSQSPFSHLRGDRKFDRFGAQMLFSDLNKDGYDDLIVGAPLRTEDITEEIYGAEQGQVYIYYGGPNFPGTAQELNLQENYSRFGSQLAVVRCKNKVNLLATAEHSSRGARLDGSIGIFHF